MSRGAIYGNFRYRHELFNGGARVAPLFERFQSPRGIKDEVIRSAFDALAACAGARP
jgi:hypothetical protein